MWLEESSQAARRLATDIRTQHHALESSIALQDLSPGSTPPASPRPRVFGLVLQTPERVHHTRFSNEEGDTGIIQWYELGQQECRTGGG